MRTHFLGPVVSTIERFFEAVLIVMFPVSFQLKSYVGEHFTGKRITIAGLGEFNCERVCSMYCILCMCVCVCVCVCLCIFVCMYAYVHVYLRARVCVSRCEP